MAADRAFFEDDAAKLAAIVQKLGRSDVAGNEDRVFWHLGAGIVTLTREYAQQPVRKVVKVVEPVAQIGVGNLFEARSRRRLFLLDSGFGRQAALDVLFHAAHPAA